MNMYELEQLARGRVARVEQQAIAAHGQRAARVEKSVRFARALAAPEITVSRSVAHACGWTWRIVAVYIRRLLA